jgi:hypothetical protein
VRVWRLDPKVVQQQHASAATERPAPPSGGDTGLGDGSKLHAAEPPKGGATFTTPDGRTITLPPGVTPSQVRAAFVKMTNGGSLTPEEQALLTLVRSQLQAPATSEGAPAGSSGSYIVFTVRGGKITAVPITTGLTDQDYVEVTGGLTERDTVVVLSGSSAR